MRPGAHEPESEDSRRDELADVAWRRWPGNQRRDAPIGLVLGMDQLSEPLNIVVRQLSASIRPLTENS